MSLGFLLDAIAEGKGKPLKEDIFSSKKDYRERIETTTGLSYWHARKHRWKIYKKRIRKKLCFIICCRIYKELLKERPSAFDCYPYYEHNKPS